MAGAGSDDVVPDLLEAKNEMEDEADWDDSGDEEAMEQTPAQCVFCAETFSNVQLVFSHCKEKHSFNMGKFSRQHQLDCFGYIKLINYIRKEKPTIENLKMFTSDSRPWNDDSFMKPVLDEDPMLQFDIDDLLVLDVEEDEEVGDNKNDDGSVVEIPRVKYRELLSRLCELDARAGKAEADLHQSMTDLAKMRAAASNLVMSAPSGPSTSYDAVQNLQEGDDDFYIDSYSHFGIHQEMLQDKVRTESYRDCMYNNVEYFKDKVVLDVGCGTGILSMFAARAGARRVIGVDMSDVIYQAIDIVRENGLEDKVTLIKGRMEDVDLPVDRVDIIISEWMGYCLLFESMLDSVLWARDRYLVEGGMVLPDHCDMRLVGVADTNLHQNNVTYWEDVYGFKMTCMRDLVMKEASVAVADKTKIATDVCVFKEIDICKCKTKDLEFTAPVQLVATVDDAITAFVVYFDINFRLPNKVSFSTGPQTTRTHWKQTIFALEKPLTVTKGQTLKGQFILRKNPKDPRSCKVTLSMEGATTTYVL